MRISKRTNSQANSPQHTLSHSWYKSSLFDLQFRLVHLDWTLTPYISSHSLDLVRLLFVCFFLISNLRRTKKYPNTMIHATRVNTKSLKLHTMNKSRNFIAGPLYKFAKGCSFVLVFVLFALVLAFCYVYMLLPWIYLL